MLSCLMAERRFVGETRKIAAILVSDVVGYSRLAGVDEDGTLSRLLRSPRITDASSSAPVTAASSSSEALSMR
jgi:hypothetical protein